MKSYFVGFVVIVALVAIGAWTVATRTKGLGGSIAGLPASIGRQTPTGSSGLPVLADAMPEFASISAWINSAPLTAAQLRGKVVLVDFWTYSCINCIRTLPYVTSWQEKYGDKGFTVIGVHTPEFAFEKSEANVRQAVGRFHITYPVALDNAYGTWNAYGNQYWPAHYLFDAQLRLRHAHFGEGAYEETEKDIQALLQEAGQDAAMPVTRIDDKTDFGKIASPETYLGYARLTQLDPSERPVKDAYATYRTGASPALNGFTYSGEWQIGAEHALSGKDAGLRYRYRAANVNLVLGGGRKRVEATLDGKPVPERLRGSDLHADASGATSAEIDGQRLYDLIDGAGLYEEHLLELHFDPGVEAYALTFG